MIALVQRVNARKFLEDFFRSVKLTDAEIIVLSEASPIRFQSIFPIETVLYIAERGKRGIPTFSPIDSNFKLRKFDVELKYDGKLKLEYTKSKELVAVKNKIGSFNDRFHWTGDQNISIRVNNPNHIFTERSRKNVWRRYEVDLQRILNEGDEERVSLTWILSNEGGQFVPFISATIDTHTDVLALRLDANSIFDAVSNVQVEVLPMQGSGEPIELINISPKSGVFEYMCSEPRLLHTYEMRWTTIG